MGMGQGELREHAESFSAWVEGQKTTLEEQIALAQHLCDNAIGKEPHQPSASEIQRMLQSAPVPSEKETMVTWKGINVGWFLDVFCQMPFMQTLNRFGCQLWFIRKVCIIEVIRRAYSKTNHSKETVISGPLVHHIDTIAAAFCLPKQTMKREPIVSYATTFVSYTGGYTFNHVQQALESLNPDEYIWMDLFCVDQFAWTGSGRSKEMFKFRESLMEDLQHRIGVIQQTALILEQWDNVMITLEQIWVLWEIFNTAEAGAELRVLLHQNEVEHFLETCLEGSEDGMSSIQESLSRINANLARAEDDVDRELIMRRMQEIGLFNVNALVISVMRDWLISKGQQRLQERRGHAGNWSVRDKTFMLNQLATLLQNQGRLSEAEPLFREALEVRRHEWGDFHEGTLVSVHNLANLLDTQGQYAEAELLYLEAIAGRKAELGGDSAGTLTSVGSLSELYRTQGRLEEAEPLMQQALEGHRTHLGNHHEITLVSINNMAELLRQKGKLAESERLHREGLELTIQQYGENHPNTLTSKNNLAMALSDQGKREEAEPLLHAVLTGLREQYGEEHQRTLLSKNNLAWALYFQGKLVEAQRLVREALVGQESKLGKEHPNTLQSMHHLGLICCSLGETKEGYMLLQNAMHGYQCVFGDHHPETRLAVSTWNSLASFGAHKQSVESNSGVCACCGNTPERLLRCGRCKKEKYCSRSCQQSSWKAHKLVCTEPNV